MSFSGKTIFEDDREYDLSIKNLGDSYEGFGMDGKEVEIPMIVPYTTKAELNRILNGEDVTPAMIKKATEHARMRIKQGKSPFKNPEDDE